MSLFLVSGLGRCGTSLLMQMLAAGGAPICPGINWPDFEHDANAGEALLPDDAAGVLKWLDPQRFEPPVFHRAVFLTRDSKQQAKSQMKMLSAWAGAAPVRADVRRMARLLERDKEPALAALRKRGTFILNDSFEELITNPAGVLAGVTRCFGMSIDHAKALACVRKRSSDCLPYMLEERILLEGPQA